MIDALVYLYATSLRNAVLSRLRRLKQPKYAIGALVGGLYFYGLLFRNVFRHGLPWRQPDTGLGADLSLLAAFVLLLVLLSAWLFPRGRAALRFTEAEAAFLFPAPLSRRALIQAKLLRSQITIAVSALLLGFVFRRGSATGVPLVAHALGWWVVLSTISLHFLGASFTRERLLEVGARPWLRGVFGASGALLLLVAIVGGIGLHWQTPDAGAGFTGVLSAVRQALAAPPLGWLLRPLGWIVAPYFATTAGALLAALAPAVAVLVLHYLWVVHADVAFEEATLEQAARRARRVAELRQGRVRFGRTRVPKAGSEPFALAARGWPPVAFLWHNLIGLGPLYRWRSVVALAIVAVAALHWLAAAGQSQLVAAIGSIALLSAAMSLLLGPAWMRREVRQLFEQLELLRALPLRGWQLVLGQLLTPLVLMLVVQWLLVAIGAYAFSLAGNDPAQALLFGAGGLATIALITPPLAGLLLCLPYAGALYFPAWAAQPGGGQGIEVMGQRMIFAFAFLFVLALALLPALLVGAVVGAPAYFAAGRALALPVAAVGISAALCLEVAWVLRWLGGKLDRFDLATELPR